MSKARAWAHAADAVGTLTVADLEVRTLGTATQESMSVHMSVGRRGPAPMLCLTDRRLGGLYFDETTAVEIARWILDTFAEATGAAARETP